jgi:hypothetical protein
MILLVATICLMGYLSMRIVTKMMSWMDSQTKANREVSQKPSEMIAAIGEVLGLTLYGNKSPESQETEVTPEDEKMAWQEDEIPLGLELAMERESQDETDVNIGDLRLNHLRLLEEKQEQATQQEDDTLEPSWTS